MDLTRAPLHEATSTSLLEHSGKFYLFVCLFVCYFVCLFVCLFSQSESKQKEECILILPQHFTFTGATAWDSYPTHISITDLKKAKSTSLKELTVNWRFWKILNWVFNWKKVRSRGRSYDLLFLNWTFCFECSKRVVFFHFHIL